MFGGTVTAVLLNVHCDTLQQLCLCKKLSSDIRFSLLLNRLLNRFQVYELDFFYYLIFLHALHRCEY